MKDHFGLIDKIVSEMSSAVESNDQARHFSQIWEGLFKGLFTEKEVAQRMLLELKSPNSHQRPNIWRVLKELDFGYWEELTSDESAYVLEYLQDRWTKFESWMTVFIASKIIGRRVPTAETIYFFRDLLVSAPRPNNALGCVGIQAVARSSDNAEISRLAVVVLSGFLNSSDRAVSTRGRSSDRSDPLRTR